MEKVSDVTLTKFLTKMKDISISDGDREQMWSEYQGVQRIYLSMETLNE